MNLFYALMLSLVAGAALVLPQPPQAEAQLAKSINGDDLKLPRSLPATDLKALQGVFSKRCTKGAAYAKVCCFIIAVEACKDPVSGLGCESKKLVGYRGCLEESCEYNCPLPEATDYFQQYQLGLH